MNALEAATAWIVATMSGPMITAILTIAVAVFGLNMLSGRVSMRRCAELTLGCFLLAGSAEVARSIIGLATSGHGSASAVETQPVRADAKAVLAPASVDIAPAGDPFDPYPGGKPVR